MSDIRALGIDVGSTTAKIVAVDAQGNLTWHLLEPAEVRVEDQVERFLSRAGVAAGQLDGLPLVATGYGRGLVHQATRKVTEITPQGDVVDFAMNDKCAAGTGRFLENTARRLGVALEQMGRMALAAPGEVAISSPCTVCADSEIISLIAHGAQLDSILRGLHRSLIKRIVAMIHSVGLAPPLMLSGGVAQNPAIRRMLEEETKTGVILPLHPQLMGAYGAALIALAITAPALAPKSRMTFR